MALAPSSEVSVSATDFRFNLSSTRMIGAPARRGVQERSAGFAARGLAVGAGSSPVTQVALVRVEARAGLAAQSRRRCNGTLRSFEREMARLLRPSLLLHERERDTRCCRGC